MAIVGLIDKRKEIPSRLSGGQQQRVSIARVVFINQYYTNDDPVGNLHSESRKRMIELFKDINIKYGIIIIYFTHDKNMSEVA